MSITRPAHRSIDDRPTRNKALVLEAMTSLFQRRDASAVPRLYAPDYIQHNPFIPQGRDALEALVSTLSDEVYYEPGLMLAEGDLVAIHGRIRGWADVPKVVVDMFRIENGQLAEHWDVLQNDASVTERLSDISMFDPQEAARNVKRTAPP
jgi:predicted SnoaL-like aldol condensation-catalyzing enzyme